MSYLQQNRLGTLKTPLGADVLLLSRFAGQEAVSQPFRFVVTALSENDAIDPADLVGKGAAVEIALPTGGVRRFHGIVSHFEQGGRDQRLATYRFELRPWLWMLTRLANCRIFQNMTAVDIVKQVFSKAGLTDHEFRVKGALKRRDYCVQYRETDFHFVSRLLEEEGCFYFFEHREDAHVLVVTNDMNELQDCPEGDEVWFQDDTGGVRERDEVTGWRVSRTFQAGKYAMRDYNFEDPGNALDVSAKMVETQTIGGNGSFEIYDYHPGDYGDTGGGDSIVRIRVGELESEGTRIVGEGEVRAFVAGHKFKLAGHYRADQNGKPHLLLSVAHELSQTLSLSGDVESSSYSNSFTCIPTDVHYRPSRVTPKPSITGPQTALVVGPAGEEIHVDEYGRVKLQFHWDRDGRKDENSSCWVRVTQVWAGKQWGALAHPRIGDEVIVTFLEGDPDQPIVTGCVYNAQRMPPYELPANKTQTGIKTRSSKDASADNFNEIRFEDKKGSEELYIHAEKDQNTIVENDQSIGIGHDQEVEIGNDQTIHVGKDRSLTVDGNETEKVDKDKTVDVTGEHDESIGKDMSLSVGGSRTMTVSKDLNETVEGAMGLKVTKDRTTTINGALTVEVGKDHKLVVKGQQVVTVTKEASLNAKKIQLVADDEITFKTGSATIVMKKNGDITINGNKITIKGSGDVVMKGSKITQN